MTSMLAVIGAVIIFVYKLCGDTCLYLKGSVWGVDLKYIGLIFLTLTLLFSLLKKDSLCLTLLSAGLGGEIFLIGYQVVNAVYCPFCLAFGAVLVLMFILNFKKTEILKVSLCTFLGFAFFFFSFSGSTHPAYAEENFISTFGAGSVKIRLYSDYFCGPCRSAAPVIETILSNLMDKKAISLTFVDTPIHKETVVYAKYFLYILNENRTFPRALVARRALYEAAGQKISTPEALEAFLAKKNIRFRQFETAPIFETLENFIKEDDIRGTPVCIIINRKGKERFLGGTGIIKGLQTIMETNAKATVPATHVCRRQ